MIPNVGKGVEQLNSPYSTGRSIIWYKYVGNLSTSMKAKYMAFLWPNAILIYIPSEMHFLFIKSIIKFIVALPAID
jgi:hypothetical protein